MKNNNHDLHHQGSPKVWNKIFANLDLTYSEDANTQGKLFEHVKIDFLKEVFPPPPTKMLEVGCGTAFVSLYFAKRGYSTTCLDANQSILKVAKENFKKERVKGKFIVGDAEKLPFKNNQFNIVTSFGLLEHFVDPSGAIAEMVRILKPGGIFFADIVPKRFSCQTLGNIINSITTFIFWAIKGKPTLGLEKAKRNFQPLYFENSISCKEYKKIITKSGLKNTEVRGNRPFPRLSLPPSLDKIYAQFLKPATPLWKVFDRWDNIIPRIWGAGLWFWGYKM